MMTNVRQRWIPQVLMLIGVGVMIAISIIAYGMRSRHWRMQAHRVTPPPFEFTSTSAGVYPPGQAIPAGPGGPVAPRSPGGPMIVWPSMPSRPAGPGGPATVCPSAPGGPG